MPRELSGPLQTPLRRYASDALHRARALPVGSARNDLRQMAIGLLWLERRGFADRIQHRIARRLAAPDTASHLDHV